MIRRRGHGQDEEESSSDEEEDAFSAMSKKTNAKKKPKHDPSQKPPSTSNSSKSSGSKSSETTLLAENPTPQPTSRQKLPTSLTSSMKRHHKPSDTRKAKMDALLQELEAEKDQIPKSTKRFVPEKKGSFVDPGEEHLTTNLFVGNLAPSITEEDLSNLFSQFGELYSVKIMWPRTMEERNRRRNTGFVCFMNRDDAEEAMQACDDTDCFNNGRLLSLRWGKSVKKIRRENEGAAKNSSASQRQRDPREKGMQYDAQRVQAPPSTANTNLDENNSTSGHGHQGSGSTSFGKSAMKNIPCYDPKLHASRAIHVEIPSDPSRLHFITIVASYVAKDPELEQRLKEEEKGNPLFSFLDSKLGDKVEVQKEKKFYRWRVYSFCQGDTFSIWRTEPFLMISSGRYWIPPPLDTDAVDRERAKTAAEKENRERQQKANRANRDLLMTGRQYERRKRRGDFGSNSSELNDEELARFDRLVRKQLSISRKTICEAMSFCFDNCMAAKQVSSLLKDALLDESDKVTNDTRIARLYLISDVLFNSQQPGVRNAFMYRTTIESMAVEIFRVLGTVVREKERTFGRITVNKLRKAVSAVLGAWTEWGVYQATFLDDLEAHFEGREVKSEEKRESAEMNKNDQSEPAETSDDTEEIVIHGPRGDWKAVSDDTNDNKLKKNKKKRLSVTPAPERRADKANHQEPSAPIGNESVLEEEIVDIAEKSDTNTKTTDGEDLDGEDLDGEDLDGEDLDGDELDGEDLDGDDLDGEDLDGEDLDGEDFNGEDLDGVIIEEE